jgi:hypothetical protein
MGTTDIIATAITTAFTLPTIRGMLSFRNRMMNFQVSFNISVIHSKP